GAKYDAGRAAAIATVALRLGSVRSVADVTELVMRDGLPILGASGASRAQTGGDTGSARIYVSDTFGEEVRRKYPVLPLDDAVPTTLTARTGTPVYIEDSEDGIARFPALAPMFADTGVQALAALPLLVDERLLGCVTFTWSTPMVFTPAATELMHALAAQAAQAVDRVRLLDVERDQSATLQRSFLTRPGRPTDVEIEVRYQPAAQHAQIGGDWYDAFVGPDGATVIAVGDVVGHDMLAAAVMGQVRNLLRGIVFSRPGSPADTLRHLEAAMAGLEFESSATVFLARLEPAGNDAAGHRELAWCNAGHPPPLLVEGRTGEVVILDPEPDLMIGVERETRRTVHRRLLAPGSLLLLYTDGLVERRGEDLQEGVSRLARALEQSRSAPLPDVADHVLAISAGLREDDAAVLALRLPAETQRRTTVDGAETTAQCTLQLLPEPASAAAARRAVRSLLAECARNQWADAAELAVSELVTNAVLHAHSELTMHAACGAELRVEVRDSSPASPVQREYGAQATTGRGMGLVAAVTQDHGVTRLPEGGKAVWFVITDASLDAEVDALGAWSDMALELEAEPLRTTSVSLRQMPATLWLAAVQQHDALLRELALLRGFRGESTDDLAAADRARSILQNAAAAALAAARAAGRARNPLPPNHPGVLDEVPPAMDLELPAMTSDAGDFGVLQDVLDEAERLASSGQMLTRPGLPEVVAVRDWACEQVIAQLHGLDPSPWPGADWERFTEREGETWSIDWDTSQVADSDRGAVAADESNRIIAISRPLADALGWDVDELVGRRVVAIVPPEFREAHVAGFTRHLTTGQAHALGVPLELPVLHANGTEILCSFFIEASRTPSGRSVYVSWVTPLGREGDGGTP
ncbi:MAG TPA: SpoIIE family protein phosphatase, partial [Mycobacteriales bacterium]|nr:SpoIIE family protein phosphatase [Mycobacteriales bacterium]